MGILECLLVIAIGLKMAGLAFASVGYLTLVGSYIGALLLVILGFAIGAAAVGRRK